MVDDQNKEIKFYVAPDNDPCQMRREVLAKHLKSILSSKAVDKDMTSKRLPALFTKMNGLLFCYYYWP